MIYRVIMLLLFSSSGFAQTFNGAPFQGAGNTGVALTSIYSITNNAAGLARLSDIEVALAYQPNYISSELSTQAFYVGVPIRQQGALGLAMNRYGLAGISSLLTISSAYSRAFADFLATSITLNYHSFSIANYGNAKSYSVDLGFQLAIIEEFTLGAVFRNISREMFAEDVNQYLPQEIALGMKYDVNKSIFIATDVYYDSFQKYNLRTGVSYDIAKVVSFRVGVATGPIQYYTGIGLRANKLQIDFSSSFHAQLGSSPQIALRYAF